MNAAFFCSCEVCFHHLLVRIRCYLWNREIRMLAVPCGLRHASHHPYFFFCQGKAENVHIIQHMNFRRRFRDWNDSSLMKEAKTDLWKRFVIFCSHCLKYRIVKEACCISSRKRSPCHYLDSIILTIPNRCFLCVSGVKF